MTEIAMRTMVYLCLCVALVVLFSRPVLAGETTVGDELQGFSSRLLDEAADFAATPFTLQEGNLFWTAGIAGAIGLTYLYDAEIRDQLQGSVRSRGMNRATDAGELLGNPYLHLGLAAAVYAGGLWADSPKWQQTGEMMVEALVLADGATLLLKQGIGRGRPSATADKGDFKPFGFKSEYDALPSMHTASSFALASVLARTSDSLPVAVASYTAATFVGFSRMYQNKHWASDVLLGAAIGELAGRVVTAFHADKERRLVILPGVGSQAVTMNLRYRF